MLAVGKRRAKRLKNDSKRIAYMFLKTKIHVSQNTFRIVASNRSNQLSQYSSQQKLCIQGRRLGA